MEESQMKLIRDPKYRIHSVVYRAEETNKDPMISSVYLRKAPLLKTFDEFPPAIMVSIVPLVK